ncbi:hypothetical protein B0H14DRAFT_3500652 [Mycena olivaceomarginata]|nr:hypothetical protein B0H14DRAFT_3500652 [Mycena olivaceomarginata]
MPNCVCMRPPRSASLIYHLDLAISPTLLFDVFYAFSLIFFGFFSVDVLNLTLFTGRSLRNGKRYAEFVQGALVVPGFRLRDMMDRHATGPQEESDGESDSELSDLTDLEEEPEEDAQPEHPSVTSPVGSPATRTPASPSHRHNPSRRESAILSAARQRWEPPTPTPVPRPASPSPTSCTLRVCAVPQRRRVPQGQSGKEACTISAYAQRESSPVPVDFHFASHLGVTSTGWMGLRDPNPDLELEMREYTYEEAQKIPGMRVVDWHGKPGPLVDADRYAFAVLGGHPRDANWGKDVAQKVAELMEEAADGIYGHVFSGVYYGTRREEKKRRKAGKATPLHEKIPRRGPHRSKTAGSSMGGGQEAPTNFFHSVLNTIVLTGLLAQEPFQRIAGFTNTLFQTYAPDLHLYYHTTMERLHNWNKKLRRNFLPTVSVFAAAAFNFGPQTVTFPHLDFANLAWGWCAITALGDFDPDRGGHIILWI